MPPYDSVSNTAVDSSEAPLVDSDSTPLYPSKETTREFPLTSEEGAGAHSPLCFKHERSSPSIDIPITLLPPVGILKSSSRYSCQPQQCESEGNDDQPDENDVALPSHWPTYRPSVRFIDDSSNIFSSASVVTSIRYRPLTPYSELSKLYYSSADYARFKHEYRTLVKAQRRRGRGAACPGDQAKNDGGGLMKNSSFWRSKVHERYYDASNSTFSSSSNGNEECGGSSSNGSLSTAAVFSSVFDVAREAVSIFSGSSNYSFYQNQSSSSQQQQHCAASKARQQQLIVDTLYLNLF